MFSIENRTPSLSRRDLVVALGLLCALLISSLAGFGADCDALRGHTVRLHILANSDAATDQALKLQVRDRILQETAGAFAQPQTRQAALATAQAQLPAIRRAAEQVLAQAGVDQPVQASLERTYFTTRQYGDLLLPAGVYDAVQVTIGEGAGHNWWCVLYPPLCVPAAAAQDAPAFQQLQQLNRQPHFKPKLAVVELVEDLLQRAG